MNVFRVTKKTCLLAYHWKQCSLAPSPGHGLFGPSSTLLWFETIPSCHFKTGVSRESSLTFSCVVFVVQQRMVIWTSCFGWRAKGFLTPPTLSGKMAASGELSSFLLDYFLFTYFHQEAICTFSNKLATRSPPNLCTVPPQMDTWKSCNGYSNTSPTTSKATKETMCLLCQPLWVATWESSSCLNSTQKCSGLGNILEMLWYTAMLLYSSGFRSKVAFTIGQIRSFVILPQWLISNGS